VKDFVFAMLDAQQHSFYELIINKARGKSGPVSEEIFTFAVSTKYSLEILLNRLQAEMIFLSQHLSRADCCKLLA
jgi:hypothetical protein